MLDTPESSATQSSGISVVVNSVQPVCSALLEKKILEGVTFRRLPSGSAGNVVHGQVVEGISVNVTVVVVVGVLRFVVRFRALYRVATGRFLVVVGSSSKSAVDDGRFIAALSMSVETVSATSVSSAARTRT